MITGKSNRPTRASTRIGIGMMVLGILAASGIALTACAPTAAPTAPTAVAGATAAAPTVAALSTAVAPTVSAAATALAPTISAVAATAAPAASTAVSQGAAAAASQLSDQGKTVFASSCAGCHGDQGQGGAAPALIGASANLGKYNTAQGLYTKISTTMPRSKPGSLTPEQYINVTAFLLLQNGYVQPSAPLSSVTLEGIPLKK